MNIKKTILSWVLFYVYRVDYIYTIFIYVDDKKFNTSVIGDCWDIDVLLCFWKNRLQCITSSNS